MEMVKHDNRRELSARVCSSLMCTNIVSLLCLPIVIMKMYHNNTS